MTLDNPLADDFVHFRPGCGPCRSQRIPQDDTDLLVLRCGRRVSPTLRSLSFSLSEDMLERLQSFVSFFPPQARALLLLIQTRS